ncbi:MAG: PH domain-containing protein [Candidatus Blackburnbacteria bacterium]|nr:PH domain-containing protein [Candidatus Blackburnbacteria bacterium]
MPDLYISNTNKVQTSRPEDKHHAPGHTRNPFAAYSYKPGNARFETQELEEKIVLLLRKHPITNIPWIVLSLALALAPLVFGFIPLATFFPVQFQTGAILLWYLLVVAIVLEGALSWFFNVYMITDERIIDVDFYNLIYREISDAKIDRIQDVTYKMGGVVGTLFNYGDVVIQTAGTIPNFDFIAVPNPAEVARVLQISRTEEEVEAMEGRVR